MLKDENNLEGFWQVQAELGMLKQKDEFWRYTEKKKDNIFRFNNQNHGSNMELRFTN